MSGADPRNEDYVIWNSRENYFSFVNYFDQRLVRGRSVGDGFPRQHSPSQRKVREILCGTVTRVATPGQCSPGGWSRLLQAQLQCPASVRPLQPFPEIRERELTVEAVTADPCKTAERAERAELAAGAAHHIPEQGEHRVSQPRQPSFSRSLTLDLLTSPHTAA